ncbi:MAG: hypothetical protein Q4C52_13010 [Eubacteriales bacterium]|nr:hypothetical protein [Eubacteriales bacterium]
MRKSGRDRKQRSLDQQQHYADLAESKPDEKAVRRMASKPYETVSGESVAEYMAKKYDIKKGLR